MKKVLWLATVLFLSGQLLAQKAIVIKGRVVSDKSIPLASVSVKSKGLHVSFLSKNDGSYRLKLSDQTDTSQTLTFSYVGYESRVISIGSLVSCPEVILHPYDRILAPVEVFGQRYLQNEKLDALTGLPPSAGIPIQSISIISNKLIAEQNILNINDAVKNTVGATLFSTFGDVVNSFTIRGIRGVALLKNGIRLNNDLRGHGFALDMEGVDQIQVLRGSSAITQGLSSEVGSAGGVINVVTKTPEGTDAGKVNLMVGSWKNVRGSFDVERSLSPRSSYRIDGAIQKGDGYRVYTKNDRFYINPSFAYRIDSLTRVVMEFDYYHDNVTPDRGTVNLGSDSVNALWNIPNNKFLGFSTDHSLTDSKTWGFRLERKLSHFFTLKLNYYGATFNQDFNSAMTTALSAAAPNVRYRYMNRVTENDKNSVVNLALIGEKLKTGFITHTIQAGFDYRSRTWYSRAFNSGRIDTINIFKDYSNVLSNQNLTYTENTGRYYNTDYNDYGVYAQDHLSLGKYIEAIGGLRYSYGNSLNNKTNTYAYGSGVDPVVGLFISPIEQIHFYGSYMSVTDISDAQEVDANGKAIGNSITHQWEAGFKSSYFQDRLRFNFTYFFMKNADYTYAVTNTTTNTVFYKKSGSLNRSGIEAELTGQLLPSLDVLLGYSYLNAEYKNVMDYVNGSTPQGTPKNLANAWAHYTFTRGLFRGFGLGAGFYYVDKRPIDDYSQTTSATVKTGGSEIQTIAAGVKPFNLSSYTTLNMQLSYTYKQLNLIATFNNIANTRGYTAYYHQGFINPTTPRNFNVMMSWAF